jgi:deferrochelatase/peroxidase EfeB
MPGSDSVEILGCNGSYVVFRKLHQRVAAFRQYLKAHARDRAEEEEVAAKLMGRWAQRCTARALSSARRSRAGR